MTKLLALFRAAHFLPTLTVTTLTFALAFRTSDLATAAGIATTVFAGQLIVGWSNDLFDYSDDRLHNREEKPLVSQQLSVQLIQRALVLDTIILFLLTVLGPLSGISGLLHLIAVMSALTYNFKFKVTRLSFLPYLISFGLLPIFILTATNYSIPIWMPIIGSLFGIGAHFANVFKDLEEDIASGILGLPQILGSKKSKIICALSFGSGALILFLNTEQTSALFILLAALVFLFPLPRKIIFPFAMALGLAVMALFIVAIS